MLELQDLQTLHSRKLTWKPKKGPIKTTVLLKGDCMSFHVSLGECMSLGKNASTPGVKNQTQQTSCSRQTASAGQAPEHTGSHGIL